MKITCPLPLHFVPWRRRLDAFSLVEVVFALAIASFGFLTLLGLLPRGLEMARNSANLAAESRITQQLSGELQSTPWTELDWTGFGPLRFFNDQGIEIQAKDASSLDGLAFTLSYVVSVQMPAELQDIILPAGTAKTSPMGKEPYLRRAKICVATTTNPKFNFGTASTAARAYRAYTVVIAKTNG